MLNRILFTLPLFLLACESVPETDSDEISETGSTETGVEPESFCGDSVVDPGEACEPGVVAECVPYGYDAGVVTCSDSCKLDLTECVFDETVSVAVFDGLGDEIGKLWGITEDRYMVYRPSADLVFGVRPENGKVLGFPIYPGYTKYNSDCSETLEFRAIGNPDFCASGAEPPSPKRLYFRTTGTFSIEVEYLIVPTWNDLNEECVQGEDACVAHMQPYGFEEYFQTPIQILEG